MREPKLYRTFAGDGDNESSKYRKRTTWLKNSAGWFCSERQKPWQSLPNPRLPITEWIERAVFVFELSMSSKQLENLDFVAAALDDRKIDIPLCNAVSWYGIFMDQGLVTNNGNHLLSDMACRVCDMVNIKWSVDDDTVDTIVHGIIVN